MFVRDFLRWNVSDEAVAIVASVADIGRRTDLLTLSYFLLAHSNTFSFYTPTFTR